MDFYLFLRLFSTFFNFSPYSKTYSFKWCENNFFEFLVIFFRFFFRTNPLKPCHISNERHRFSDRNGIKNFKIRQILSDLWPKEGISSGESKVAPQGKNSYLGVLDQSIYIWVSRRAKFRRESFSIDDFFVKLKVFA